MKIAAEPEQLDARVPLGILAVTLVTLLLGAGLTLGVRALAENELHRPSIAAGPRPLAAANIPPAQPSGLFGRHTPARATRQLPSELGGYGWVNREQGLVRIPLERAKHLYLEQRAVATEPIAPAQGSQR